MNSSNHGTDSEPDDVVEALDISAQTLDDVEIIAHRCYSTDRVAEARKLLEGILAVEEARPYPHLLLGDIALQNDAPDTAVDHLERARQLDPDDLSTKTKLAEAHLRLDAQDKARAVLEEALDHPERTSRHYKRAEYLYDEELPD